jgi:hypothetical protein
MVHGYIFNSSEFMRLAGLAYSSAYKIFSKISAAVQETLEESLCIVQGSLFARAIGRRSSATPAFASPQQEMLEEERSSEASIADQSNEVAPSEQNNDDCIEQVANRLTCGEQSTISEPPAPNTDDQTNDQALVLECLSSGSMEFEQILSSTRLSTGQVSLSILNLELSGFIERKFGGRYALAARKKVAPLDPETSRFIDNFCAFVQSIYQRISRKHLQMYLAAYWCFMDRNSWSLKQLLMARHRSRHSREIVVAPIPKLIKLPKGSTKPEPNC